MSPPGTVVGREPMREMMVCEIHRACTSTATRISEARGAERNDVLRFRYMGRPARRGSFSRSWAVGNAAPGHFV